MLDKNDPATYNHCYCTTNGIRMHYVDENPSGSVAVLLIHGFPDLFLGWREQIAYLSKLGYRVIAPSLRGFGETDSPADPSVYRSRNICKDLTGLLDHLQLPTVVVLGHDWGGYLAWRFAVFHPERVIAVGSFCTPYTPPSRTLNSLEHIVKRLPNFGYQMFFCTAQAEEEMNARMRDFLARIHRPSGELVHQLWHPEVNRLFLEHEKALPKCDLIAQPVFDYYVTQWERTGARGGLNLYKQTERNYEDFQGITDDQIHKPALMVCAEKDEVLKPERAIGMEKFIPQLEMKLVKDAGHWVLWEKPDECNQHLKEWLSKVAPLPSMKEEKYDSLL